MTSVRLLADVVEGKDGGWEIYAVNASDDDYTEEGFLENEA